MKTFVTIVKAVVTRVLFATHAFIAVWKLVDLKGGQTAYWYMVAPLMLQGFEGIVSICARNGEEMKWFCPSVFLYLVSVVPPIWLMELELNDLRVNSTHEIKTWHSEIGGVKLDLALPIEQWVRVLEQVMLVMLLVGRWLLPKGKLTREQLSQLLLAYMAMAADVIELFECFKEDAVTRNKELIYATLGIWSWSLLQFTLVLSATYSPKQRPSIVFPPPQEVTIMTSGHTNQRGRRGTQTTCTYNINMYLDMNIVAILTTVFMQDGPFFLLRMTLIFGYKVVSYLNIFFTCKNTLVMSLQLYRLFVLCSRKRLLNQRRKELLSEVNSPTEGSEEEGEEEDVVEETLKVKDTNLLPSPPPPPTPPPPPPQETPIDGNLQASLLEIIEQVGEETIVKELENLVSLNAEKDNQINPASSLKDVSDLKLMQMQGKAEFEQSMEDDFFLQDPDFQNSSGLPVFPGRRSNKLLNRVQQESISRTEDFPSCCEVSDCPSFSDTDQANDRFFFDQQGVSASSTSLAEPFISEPQQSRWPLLREQYLLHHQEGQKGASVPSGLHRGTRRKLTQIGANPPFPDHPSFSPEPHRRIKRRPDSRYRGGSTRSLCQGPVLPPAWNSPLHRHSSFIQRSRYTGISESDADTMETNV